MASKDTVASQSMKRAGLEVFHLLETTSSWRCLAESVDCTGDWKPSCVSSECDHLSISVVEKSAGAA